MTAPPTSEQQLLARLQKGKPGEHDSTAFRQLLAPYERKLQAQVLRIVRDASDAEDAMQETRIRLYRGVRDFRGDACLYTWMYRVATNVALAMLRRRKRTLPEHGHAELVTSDVQNEHRDWLDPERIVAGKQMLTVLGNALDSLSPEYQKAITLRELEGLSYDEIAHNMVCPVGTVKSRISTARSAIFLSCKRAGYDPACKGT